MKKCSTKYCRKNAVKHRAKCHSCVKKDYAERNPMKYAFMTLRQNAKRRGKSFELSFEQFKRFAIESDYMAGKGITKTSFHIDRIDPERGYSIDNIRVLTNSENVKRHRQYLKYNFGPDGKPVFRVEGSEPSNAGDAPF